MVKWVDGRKYQGGVVIYGGFWYKKWNRSDEI
jgi:hypothetical protein